MKTIKYAVKCCAANLMIAAVAIGCTNNEINDNAPVDPESNGIVIITASVDQSADTRMEYEDNGSGPIKTLWNSTDKIGMFTKDGNDGKEYANSLTEGNTAEKTNFTGTNLNNRYEEVCVAVYPTKPGGNAFDPDVRNYTLTTVGQTQNGNNNTEHLSAYDYMYDDDITIEEVGEKYQGDVSFTRQMAMLKFKLTLPPFYDNTINGAIANISLSTTDKLFTSSRKLLDATAVPDAYGVTLALTGMETYDGSDPLTAYMMIHPADLNSKTVTIEVATVNGHRFTISKTVNRAFKAGSYYTMTIASGWTLLGSTQVTFTSDTQAAGSFASGDGRSEYTPYYIANENQLKKLVDDVANGESYADTYFKLDADIEITADAWTSIGNGSVGTRAASTPFAGHFDGNGHSITGQFNHVAGTANANRGFFGYVTGGSIKNLNNKATVNATGCMQIGSIVGTITNGLISNCTNTGDVTGGSYTGGIAGVTDRTNIINCKNSGDITSSATNVGGIVSKAEGSSSTITGCENDGNVTGTGTVGGIAGETEVCAIINSRNEGKVACTKTGDNCYTGGIAGKSTGKISYSTNAGEVDGGGTSTVGGIAGQATKEVSFCTNEGAIKGAARLGGIVGHLNGTSSVYVHKNHNASSTITGTSLVGTIVGYLEGGTVYDCNTSVTVTGLELIGGTGSTTPCTNSGHK